MSSNYMELQELFKAEPSMELARPQVSPLYDPSSLSFLEGIHRRKSEGLRLVIAEQGWPSASLYGTQAEAAAFMIAQHADYDLELQEACHKLLLESVFRGSSKNLGFLAFLTDRILCNKGRHQRFGTQVRELANGCFVPKAMEDPEQVDLLRERAGLQETLTDYLHRINNGDLVFYRFVLNGYAEELEHVKEHKVVPFPQKSH